MKLFSVFDPEFKPYGRVVEGMQESIAEICSVLAGIPVPEDVAYMAEEPKLQSLSAAIAVQMNLFGGMPVQMGWCNGHNTKLNCLEYHRCSEFNVGTDDFVLLLAKQDEITDGFLNTDLVKAFRVPAGVMVECYATSLHYAPCHTHPEKGFQVLIALPKGTNTEKPQISVKTFEDRLLFAKNKWLLAHPDSTEAFQGAYVGLQGCNIDIVDML